MTPTGVVARLSTIKVDSLKVKDNSFFGGKTMRVINEIINCEIGYMTIHEKRARILAYIRGKGVAFKDVKSFLEKEAIKEGKASSPAEIETDRVNKLAWVVYLDRYVKWIEDTYKAGWVEKKKPEKKSTKKETPNGVVAIPKALTKKRAEKMVENPETRKSIEEALIESGSIVVDNELISERLVERLLEKEENEKTIIKALNALGYKVTRPKAK